MVKRMLIDATHAEETRVVVLDGSRLEEFDVETSTKRQLKGNIYLAKIVRVEPSLQAAFVEYGGGRHGFLPFNEIHPDYYQIPVADRQALLADQREVMRASSVVAAADFGDGDEAPAHAVESDSGNEASGIVEVPANGGVESAGEAQPESLSESESDAGAAGEPASDSQAGAESELASDSGEEDASAAAEAAVEPAADVGAATETESAGGEDEPEETAPPRRPRSLRHYKIQEVIKRRQVVLVQVVKEERGTKGAALTTYLSLAGRYCVLMPNTARGGGVSRKITSATDRKRLKTIVNDLEIPDGMAVIIRTAGSERTKPEVKRDYEYLLRLWDSVRELTLQSTAPTLVYEEANLIKRSIRDLYARDIDEILVEGEEGYRLAKDFMRMLTPSHAKKVQLFKDPAVPLFHRFQVESQLDAMHGPVVQLKSGGYVVFNQTEALVAIDVNSGRATRERHIEETALKTNLEAADEVARQLRLRDLAGLIVIDFIDMEDARNNHSVERRLKDAMRSDRARIQLGKISAFGLLELSRQRLRPSLIESSFQPCSHCGGTGMVRSVESSAVHVLRAIEEEGIRHHPKEIHVTLHPQVALYVLNQKRAALIEIESRYGMRVLLAGDDKLVPPAHRIERVKVETETAHAHPVHMVGIPGDRAEGEEEAEERPETEPRGEEAERHVHARRGPHSEAPGGEGPGGDGQGGGRRRRRRRRRGGRRDEFGGNAPQQVQHAAPAEAEPREEGGSGGQPVGEDGQTKRRRRGRRGGRRRNRGREGNMPAFAGANSSAQGGDLESAGEPTVEREAPAASDQSEREPEARPVRPDSDPAAPSATAGADGDEGSNGGGRSRRGRAASQALAEPKEPAPAAPPPPPPEPEEPAGPPRRGWWNRLG